MLLLALDLLMALGLRGLLRPRPRSPRRCCSLLLARAGCARAGDQPPIRRWRRGSATSSPATPRSTACRAAGLEGLSDYVNRRTAATLVEPDAVEPGKTDLSFYPLLYWPITADAQPLDAGAGARR